MLALLITSVLMIPRIAQAQTNPKHFFWAPGQPQTPNPSSLANDLIYHGGNAGQGAIGVENKPATYLIFWGPDWANGFTTTDVNGQVFTSQQLQNYVTSFLTNLGGTSWAAIQTEYCNNVSAGTTSCASVASANYITNPRKQLKGVWTDSTAVPSDIVASGLAQNLADDPIAQEAIRASAHFNYDPQATYIVLTPATTIATGQPVYCGYHTQTTSVNGLGNPYRLQYAFIPFLNANWPGLGTGGCGMNSVNVVSDSFGHGVFDGYSIVVGHEYAEAVTDPDNFASDQDGWNDAQGSENGDKCAWTALANVSMNSNTKLTPKIYLVLWGWGEAGAFNHTNAGLPANDPDGVAALMTRFIAAIGGTSWGNISTQYYQSNYNGTFSNVGNPKQELAGVWHDDTTPIHNNMSPLELAQEAGRAAQHFGVTNLTNANLVVATPQMYNDAGFNQGSYCAWHDYVTPISYPGVTTGMAFTNMPYVLNAGGGCGQEFVNPAPAGNNDGVTIVLGHEIAETLTDPGAEESAGQVQNGAWSDYQGWEIGDKCAWVGNGLQIPGSPFNMVGNDGRTYPVQTLWNNQALSGAGYCTQN